MLSAGMGAVVAPSSRVYFNSGSLKISLAMGIRREEVYRFCNEAYARHGYLTQPSHKFPNLLFAVEDYETGRLRGSVGIYTLQDVRGKPFPTEEVFDFSVLQNLGYNPWDVGEVCRLTTDGQGDLFVPLMGFLWYYMNEELGLRYAMFGIKPIIHRMLDRMGIPMHVHTELSEPNLDAVPEEFLPYFVNAPRPMVVSVDTEKARAPIMKHLERLT